MHYYYYYSRDETAARNYKLAYFLNSTTETSYDSETNIIVLYVYVEMQYTLDIVLLYLSISRILDDFHLCRNSGVPRNKIL